MRRVAAAQLLVLFAACSAAPHVHDAGPGDEPDAGEVDAGEEVDAGQLDAGEEVDAGRLDAGLDAGPSDGGPCDGGADAGPIFVGHVRELRGLWFTTAFSLDFPLSAASSRDAGVAELGKLVDLAATLGFNAIFFQTRPESDTFHISSHEPWSRFLTGTQGQSPGYDPLETVISLAHARGLEVHAWVNPYRGLTNTSVVASPSHITQVLPQHAITYGSAVVMDPSAAAVQDWVVSEIDQLIQAYDLDGLHFDDYFYPYPLATPFPDDNSYQGYVTDGGAQSRSAWRRDQVNALVKRVSQVVASRKSWVRFGISPFGIYRPGYPAGITGLDAYETLSCDSLAWLSNGWVDYLAPQLYWPTTQVGQEFGKLIKWWSQQVSNGQSIFGGLGAHRLGSSSAWTLTELATQVQLTRAEAPRAQGNLWFRYEMIRDDWQGIRQLLRTDLYARPALPPPVASQRNHLVACPTVTVNGSSLSLTHADPLGVRGYGLYRFSLTGWQFDRFVPQGATVVGLPTGPYAITAIDRSDVESLGVPVTVP